MKKLLKKSLYKGKWISLNAITYLGKKNEKLVWEGIERTNTSKTVVILAKLVPSNRYVLIKQYRPVIDNYIIGLPAGLMEDDDIIENSLRELKEETGYKGKVTETSPTLYSNAALLSDTVRLVTVDIDETLPDNINPVQNLEAEEDIDVILVNENDVLNFLREQEGKNTAVGIGCWYIFYGLSKHND